MTNTIRVLEAKGLGDYTKISFEILVITLSIAPILILIYFYPVLPERVPVFLNLRGEVEVWAAKSVASIFRLPAMAIDLQVLCLLMKYGVVKSTLVLPKRDDEYWRYQERSVALYAGLWDCLRCLIAFKMSAESLDILFRSNERLHFLRMPAWAVPWIAAILSIAGALLYGYRLLIVRRKMKKAVGRIDVESRVDPAHLYLRIFYFNPNDAAMFANKYLFNFANKWVYVLLASAIAYPLLVFSPL
jgi:uncharacterized membrane protein